MINVKTNVLSRDRKPVLKAMWGKKTRCHVLCDLRNSDEVGDARE